MPSVATAVVKRKANGRTIGRRSIWTIEANLGQIFNARRLIIVSVDVYFILVQAGPIDMDSDGSHISNELE